MKYDYSSPKNYFAEPFIGNGSITLPLGPDGSMNKLPGDNIISHKYLNVINRAGRRHVALTGNPMMSHGRFTDDLGCAPIESDESLDPKRAEITCDTLYPCGRIATSAFVHAESDLVAIKKRLEPTGAMHYRFTYYLCGRGASESKVEFTETSVLQIERGGRIDYKMTDRLTDSHGSIAVVCDSDVKITLGANSVAFELTTDTARELCFYIIFSDTGDHAEPSELADSYASKALTRGYDALMATNFANWSRYYAEGHASIGDDKIDRVYLTAQYHQRIFTTKWSLPVGLYQTCWDGRYFGFDEHYMQMGLLTSNHIEAASHVPKFRRNGLSIATSRTTGQGARYPWETLENGTEAAPIGFWMDHVFHMCAIPLSGWEYYRYTLDVDFLREIVYPVITECVKFFEVHMLVKDEHGRLIIGKCTDLERLGNGKQNAYMTTCGVIVTFRAFAKATRVLGLDDALAAKFESYADELHASLPHDGEKYIPYPGCPDRSIGVFSGTYPFDAISRDDEKQSAAIDDYVRFEDEVGNMYATGRGVCSWYACWKAVVYDRLGRSNAANAAIAYVADTAGDFDELFEINDRASNCYWHPWFTTAAGMYVHALNEALVYSEDEVVHLFSGIDDEHLGGTISFRLAAHGDMVIECEVESGELIRLDAIGGARCEKREIRVRLPERFGGEHVIAVK